MGQEADRRHRLIAGLDRLAVMGALILIRAYQVAVAPLLIGGCRHWPTCSQYAVEALRSHGARRGSMLAARRLWRCRPGGSYGYDPVPGRDEQLPRRPLVRRCICETPQVNQS